MRVPLSKEALIHEAHQFKEDYSPIRCASLYGRSDGKAVGDFLQKEFTDYLAEKYLFQPGSSAKGLDFLCLNIDLKCTSARQPQSSLPFKSADQKIYGMGYDLLIFVYEKIDSKDSHESDIHIQRVAYYKEHETADYELTKKLKDSVEAGDDNEKIEKILRSAKLPVADHDMNALVNRIKSDPPKGGKIGVSNALQWRANFGSSLKR